MEKQTQGGQPRRDVILAGCSTMLPMGGYDRRQLASRGKSIGKDFWQESLDRLCRSMNPGLKVNGWSF